MKRKVLFAALLTGAIATMTTKAAETTNYVSLTIEKTDGTSQSLTAIGLSITYANGMFAASNETESVTLPLIDICSMYFSNQQVTTAANGISTVNADVTTADYSVGDGIYNLVANASATCPPNPPCAAVYTLFAKTDNPRK